MQAEMIVEAVFRGLKLKFVPEYRFHETRKWRIDYFLVSKNLEDKLHSVDIHTEIYGSDHCPVELVLDIE